MANELEQAREALDRLERAAMAYERLGKLTKDDEKTRVMRKDTITEIATARREALASLSSAVDGAKAEPVAWMRRSKSIYGPYADEYTGDPELAELWRSHPNTIEVIPLSKLASPSTGEEAGLRERVEAVKWRMGEPPKPWRGEWFIALTTYGDRVVLTALPEEWTYDYKTADDTYIKADKIKAWMQFPDSQFIEYAEARLAQAERATAVTVKPLEWVSDMDTRWAANSAAGSYYVLGSKAPFSLYLPYHIVGSGDFETRDAAKAAAQADYEARILSALAEPQQAVTEAEIDRFYESLHSQPNGTAYPPRQHVREAFEAALRTSSTGGKG